MMMLQDLFEKFFAQNLLHFFCYKNLSQLEFIINDKIQTDQSRSSRKTKQQTFSFT